MGQIIIISNTFCKVRTGQELKSSSLAAWAHWTTSLSSILVQFPRRTTSHGVSRAASLGCRHAHARRHRR